MISRIGYNEYTEQLTDDPDGDMVLYEDYQALEAENQRLREVLETHDEVITELCRYVEQDDYLEQIVEAAWEDYKEVMKNEHK